MRAMRADTPMPGEDPGALIEDPSRLDEIEPPNEEGGDRKPAPPREDAEAGRARPG